MAWQTALEAAEAIRNQKENTPIQCTAAMKHEYDRLDKLCSYMCNGSTVGVGDYVHEVVARSGCSLERVSYAWRTRKSLCSFLASLA